eukprot:1999940-Pleurochrysis_carterae.AAC.2
MGPYRCRSDRASAPQRFTIVPAHTSRLPKTCGRGTHTRTHAYAHARTHARTHVKMHSCAYIHTRTHTRTHTHEYAHAPPAGLRGTSWSPDGAADDDEVWAGPTYLPD